MAAADPEEATIKPIKGIVELREWPCLVSC